ncbi:MAG: alpha-1,2-fucosyltransferase [bacterium]|nr:alpha-1,2-fucosyltransferase [bacterium]
MTSNKIIIKLQGGLGNQMFQYAVGRHLSHITKAVLKLDIASFKDDPKRNYSLGCFNLQKFFATDEEIRWFKKYQRKPGKIWFLYNRLVADETKYVKERQFHFDQKILQLKPPAHFDGYWQTEKYFKDIAETIRKEFTLKNSLSNYTKLLQADIMSKEAVSIHVRRGDYISDKHTNEWHGSCSIEYYNQAIQKIAEHVKNPHFFIFSDDPAWIKKNILPPFPTTCLPCNAEYPEEDLYLMSRCKHHIIANSSFSWWGAWLNPNKEKVVIAPKRWFQAPKMDTNDLIPNSWIRI